MRIPLFAKKVCRTQHCKRASGVLIGARHGDGAWTKHGLDLVVGGAWLLSAEGWVWPMHGL